MKKYIVLFLLYGCVIQAEEKENMLQIFSGFTASNAAMMKCLKPDENELNKFLDNYKIAAVNALQEIQKNQSSIPNEMASKIMIAGGKETTKIVNTEIEKNGCKSQKIQELIKLFHFYAERKPIKNG